MKECFYEITAQVLNKATDLTRVNPVSEKGTGELKYPQMPDPRKPGTE